MNNDKIVIKGAKENNLKNVSLEIPRNKLVIMTGLSGSGKTSLAFDTIYAEGQRRYVESLSSYARQFLGNMEKPDVELIEGLSPAIAIDQKTTSNNPRSTVGTVTEIYDYLRLMYARVGVPYCPIHGIEITSQTIKQMVDRIMDFEDQARLEILAPIVKDQKGEHKELLESMRKEGFVRAYINGEMVQLDEPYTVEKNKKNSISIVVDRIIKKEDSRFRLSDSLETAIKISDGIVNVKVGSEIHIFSSKFACPVCGFSVPSIEPRLFSFNSPMGACHTCNGLGITQSVDVDYLIPDPTLTIMEGGIRYYKNIVGSQNIEWQTFEQLMKFAKVNADTPINKIPKAKLDILLYGSQVPVKYIIESRSGNVFHRTEVIEGVVNLIERRFQETTSTSSREWYGSFHSESTCTTCHGSRLNESALSVKVDNTNISEFTHQSIRDALHFMEHLELEPMKAEIAELVIQEIVGRLSFLKDVGLDYLTLDRIAGSLSGGESQRIRLATQIGSRLTGVLYVLDEPSIGLHQRDNARLIETLKNMRDLGNTLLVVEHDEETMEESDWIVDIGPGAGALGGEVIANGPLSEIIDNEASLTAAYLSGRRKIPTPTKRRKGNKLAIEIVGASENNLKNLTIKFPLGTLTSVTGVSGSGKSSLVNEVLSKAVYQSLGRQRIKPGKHKRIKGLENIDKLITIDQNPIGRTPRSNPATYTGVFDDIRDLFAKTQEAKMRGYDKGRFSFNVAGGRCEVCKGDGVKRISMHFLPDVYVKCTECDGRRYNEETLQVRYKDKTIYDVLEMSIDEGVVFFDAISKIRKGLQTLSDVGLGYIKLGQSATTLSGGEAQRVKLASELQRPSTGKTMFVLDEPTTGLHSYDVEKLIGVLQHIVDNGDTVVVIEHNLDVIKNADYVIDLGPEGGDGGGTLVAKGTPEAIIKVAESHTGQYLKKVLDKG
ncbi:excinuclease ABC subunit UvrA [Erysipelothrix sp. HDW6B]|uniref:excinuclease ABC subunit UvrA n=1 Tax=Erysipelothrix sp. HDW6B TaxID=2714929 RepID=UPI001409D5E6|nr:excinuclease ABC subunit UvrA [Erysipelothrix sp. HDW6B]QIK87027.1 excinuclease ABC subunit UvrA [Erysipelothrix sp. HDW6B]